jgi:hypothetical protein
MNPELSEMAERIVAHLSKSVIRLTFESFFLEYN